MTFTNSVRNSSFCKCLTYIIKTFLISSFQLNLRRGIDRRKPDNIQSLNMPFDPNKFNFTKVKEGEILFEVFHGNEEHVNGSLTTDTSETEISQVILKIHSEY